MSEDTNNPVYELLTDKLAEFQTLRPGISLSAWSRPWILLGGLQTRVRDSLSPETAFGLQYRRRGSCHTPVFTWRPRISGRRSSGMECVTALCHLHAVCLFIPATSENFCVSATTAWITLITVSWSWSAWRTELKLQVVSIDVPIRSICDYFEH